MRSGDKRQRGAGTLPWRAETPLKRLVGQPHQAFGRDESRPGRLKSTSRAILISMLRFYKRAVSPLLPGSCRYYPSCSDYVREAIEKHGAARGLWLGVFRLLRCQPFSRGGVDPVP